MREAQNTDRSYKSGSGAQVFFEELGGVDILDFLQGEKLGGLE
jgi:hypothetical protein